MDIGVSSACFYPLETEKSLIEVGKLDVHTSEIFFNSDSELGEAFLKELCKIKDYYSIKTPSIHPFTSFCESFFFFSKYKKRFYEAVEYYKRYFNAANIIGAKILVFHGAKVPIEISEEEYFERFAVLYEAGKKFGVTVAQENVWSTCGADPDFLRKMKKYLGDDFKLNFDVKQMRKCGYVLSDFLCEFSKDIVNIHVSDHNKSETCLPPGEGEFSFEEMFRIMQNSSYDASFIIELYRHNFKEAEDIKKSYEYLKKKAIFVEK